MFWLKKQKQAKPSVVYWNDIKWPSGPKQEAFKKWVALHSKMLGENASHIEAMVKLAIMDPQTSFNLVLIIAHDCLTAGFEREENDLV